MKNIFNNLSIMLVLFIGVLASSCSDFERENPLDPKAANYIGSDSQPQVTLCVYEGYGMCESFDGAECPFGGVPALECPYSSSGAAGSSSSGGGEPAREYGYCVYASVSMCSAKGAYTSCLPSGELSDSCPYGSSSSATGDKSSSSFGGSSSSGSSSSSRGSSSSGSLGSGSSSSAGDLCAGFVEGIPREHYYKYKPQFCDPRDGKKYVYVKIGTQTWMAENLNYAVGGKCGSPGTASLLDENNATCDTYGRLYTWVTAMNETASSTANPSGVQGICPVGWHLPSNAEWDALVKYISDDKSFYYSTSGGSSDYVGKYLRTASGWNSSGDTDEYEFSALPGGYGASNDSFLRAESYGYWWSTTEHTNSTNAYYRYISNDGDYIRRDYINKSSMSSVRCVKN